MNLGEVFHEGAERDVQMLLACHGRVREVLTAVWDKYNKVLDRVFSCPDSYNSHKNTDGSTRRPMVISEETVIPANLQLPATFKELMDDTELIENMLEMYNWVILRDCNYSHRKPFKLKDFVKYPVPVLIEIRIILGNYFMSRPELTQREVMLFEQRMMYQLEAQADRVLDTDQIEHRFSLLGIRVSYLNGGMEIEYNGQSADMSPEYFVKIIDIREFEMLIIENAVKQGRLKPQDLYRAIKCGYPSFYELIEQIA